MELDRNLVDRITELDDVTLNKSIGKVAESMGIDASLAQMYLGDMSKIREAVKNLTQEDLNQITQTLGQENTQKLVENIRKEMGGN